VIELCDLIRTRVHDMNYVNVATAFGTMAKVGSRGRGDPRTAKAKRAAVVALTERALQQLEDFKPQNVANTLWALAKMRVEADKRLLRALSLRATASAADFKPQEVANTLWAFATMGVKADKRLLEALSHRATASAADFKPQEVENTLWAFCLLQPSLLPGLCGTLLSGGRELGEMASCQLHQVFVTMQLKEELWSKVPPNVRTVHSEIGGDCKQQFQQRQPMVSGFQREVSAAVRSMGLELIEEAVDEESSYSLDILLRKDAADAPSYALEAKSGWAVEVNGPSHYVQNLKGESRPNGSTLLKQRHLEGLGYALISIPYWEWDQIRGKEERVRYLAKKLHLRGE